MGFIRTIKESEQYENVPAYWFVFTNGSLLIDQPNSQAPLIPFCRKHELYIDTTGLEIAFLGFYHDRPCLCAVISEIPDSRSPFKLINLRKLYGTVTDDVWNIAGYARQVADFYTNFKYCSKCGTENKRLNQEHAYQCAGCGMVHYPRIYPAIITAVTKKDRILLARGVNFPNKKMFSVLAGFVEPGETLEECVSREVREESGIHVTNIRYFGSQPWPFPDSLMIGFTAEYKSGTIQADKREIEDAGWFQADNLPLVPGKPSIAGELIQWFIDQNMK